MPNHGQYDHHWRKLRAQVLAEERYVCWLCGKPGADSVDHKVPLVERPDLRLDRSNLRAAHLKCNSGRVSARLKRIRDIDPRPGTRRKWLPS